MKRKMLVMLGLIAILTMLVVTTVSAAGNSDLAKVRRATARYHRLEVAQDAGYDFLVPFNAESFCFDNPGVGGMGYHYLDESNLLNPTLDAQQPEVLVYVPGPHGKLQLGAVEYIVPAGAWDAVNNDVPSVLGQDLHLTPDGSKYILHAWIWKHNPAGMFEDWNPNVSCP